MFPTDTLYGIGCRPDDEAALARVYELKGRPPEKPSAVMWFSLEPRCRRSELGPRTRAALERLLPGPGAGGASRWAGGAGAAAGGRSPPLARVRVAVLQTSANLSGGPDPRRLSDVPGAIRDGADLVLDGGELPGAPSTVVDLTRYEEDGRWEVLRDGARGAKRRSPSCSADLALVGDQQRRPS